MQIFLSVILTLAAVIIIFLIASFLIFKSTFGKVKGIKKIEEDFYKNLEKNSNKKYAQKITSGKEKILSLDYEEIGIMSYDEFPLSGKLYLADGAGDKTVLLCHGYKSCGEFDFSQLFFEYRKCGFNILMIDQRAHAKSGGNYCSLGINESFDVLSWCRWLEMRFGTGCPITLHGVSMGAFSVLAASANSNLPKNVVRVVAESAYDSAVTVFTTSAERTLGFLGKIFVAPVNMMCRFFAGFDMRDLSLARLAPRVKIPVMLVISQNDSLITAAEQKEIAAAIKSELNIIEVKTAPHSIASVWNENDCVTKIMSFVSE